MQYRYKWPHNSEDSEGFCMKIIIVTVNLN